MLNKVFLTLLVIPFALNAGPFTKIVNQPLEDKTTEAIAKRKIEINAYVFDKYTEYTTISDMYLILANHRAVPDTSSIYFHRISEHYRTRSLLWFGTGQLAKCHLLSVAMNVISGDNLYENQYHPNGRGKSLKESMNFHGKILMKLKALDEKIIPCDRVDYYAAKSAVKLLIKYEDWKESYASERYRSLRDFE